MSKRLVLIENVTGSHVATLANGEWKTVCGLSVPQASVAEIAGNTYQATCAKCVVREPGREGGGK